MRSFYDRLRDSVYPPIELYPKDRYYSVYSLVNLPDKPLSLSDYPNSEGILEGLRRTRSLVDKFVLKRTLSKKERRAYPVGCCHHIVSEFFSCLMDLRDQQETGVGLDNSDPRQLSSLVCSAEVFRLVYGIRKKSLFSNMIQLDNLVLDPANDSVIDEPNWLFIQNVRDINFNPLNNPELIADVLQGYWNYDVYPNNIFPELALVDPYIVIDFKGLMGFTSIHKPVLFASEVHTNFDATRKFLTSSKYSTKVLPKEFRDCIVSEIASRGVDLETTTPKEFPFRLQNILLYRSSLSPTMRERFDSRMYHAHYDLSRSLSLDPELGSANLIN